MQGFGFHDRPMHCMHNVGCSPAQLRSYTAGHDLPKCWYLRWVLLHAGQKLTITIQFMSHYCAFEPLCSHLCYHEAQSICGISVTHAMHLGSCHRPWGPHVVHILQFLQGHHPSGQLIWL